MTKEQIRDYYRKWAKKNKDRRNLYNKEWYQKNIEKMRLAAKERYHKYRGPLKTDWIYTKKMCRFCKTDVEPLMKSSRRGDRQYYSCRPCNTKRLKEYRKTEKGAERVRLAVYASTIKLQYKQDARMKLNYALKMGVVTKPESCKCGNSKVEAHHEDYDKPLEVIWLCRGCHADIHRLRKEAQPSIIK